MSAHPKVDDTTGELLFFNYSKQAPYMHYGVVDENNDLVHYVDVPLPGPRLPHDMAFTENYVDPQRLSAVLGSRAAGAQRARRRGSTATCRRASRSSPAAARAADIRWFEAEPDLRAALHQRLRGRRRDRPRRLLPGRPGAGRQRHGQQVAAGVPLPGAGPDAGPAAPLAVQPRHRRRCARSSCPTASPSSA